MTFGKTANLVKSQQFPFAARDRRGRLRVGAAVGVHDYERAEALIEADVDIVGPLYEESAPQLTSGVQAGNHEPHLSHDHFTGPQFDQSSNLPKLG